MRNYKHKTERGEISKTLLRQAANAGINTRKSVKTVAKNVKLAI